MAASQNQHTQKIVSLLNNGQRGAAAKAAKAAMKAFPKDPQFPNMAATIAAQGGDPRAAVPLFLKALKLRPGDAGIQDNLVQALIESGQNAKARDLISKLLLKRPNSDRLFHLRATSYLSTEEVEDAMEAAGKAIELNPENALAYNCRGVCLRILGQHEDAIEDFRHAHTLLPNDPDPLNNMSRSLEATFQTEPAFEAARQARILSPNHVPTLQRYAILAGEIGKFEESIATYHEILKIDPLHEQAFTDLIWTQSREENEKLRPALERALVKTPKKSEKLVRLNLAMGNLLLQQGDYDNAAQFLSTSNRLEFQRRKYSLNEEREFFEKSKALFPTNSEVPTASSATRPTPIFVLGQPRSGTTLTEMILSSLENVAPCGEQETAIVNSKKILREGLPFEPNEFAEKYRGSLPPLPEEATHFVDKMPSNYLCVGFLLAAFPKAPIIHITRDPRDVALSMWRTYFPDRGLSYTFDLKTMAEAANLYQEYMRHWQAMAGDRILTLDYSDLVSDIETSSRRMAEFCGLNWSEAMMAPEHNTARVSTASLAQVREGVHSKSIGGWRRMEKALKPFTDALDPNLWPELDG